MSKRRIMTDRRHSCGQPTTGTELRSSYCWKWALISTPRTTCKQYHWPSLRVKDTSLFAERPVVRVSSRAVMQFREFRTSSDISALQHPQETIVSGFGWPAELRMGILI